MANRPHKQKTQIYKGKTGSDGTSYFFHVASMSRLPKVGQTAAAWVVSFLSVDSCSSTAWLVDLGASRPPSPLFLEPLPELRLRHTLI